MVDLCVEPQPGRLRQPVAPFLQRQLGPCLLLVAQEQKLVPRPLVDLQPPPSVWKGVQVLLPLLRKGSRPWRERFPPLLSELPQPPFAVPERLLRVEPWLHHPLVRAQRRPGAALARLPLKPHKEAPFIEGPPPLLPEEVEGRPPEPRTPVPQ